MVTLERFTFLEEVSPQTWYWVSFKGKKRIFSLTAFGHLALSCKKALPSHFTHLQFSSSGNTWQFEKYSLVRVIHTDLETPHMIHSKSVQSVKWNRVASAKSSIHIEHENLVLCWLCIQGVHLKVALTHPSNKRNSMKKTKVSPTYVMWESFNVKCS